jgi:hypothetical protein
MTTARTSLARLLVPVPVLGLALMLAASACTDRRPDANRDTGPAPTNAPPALTAAHEAYLAGDYVEMGERLRDVIVDSRSGELAIDNAFALLESAYEATRGQLPARTPVPQALGTITLGVMNGVHAWGAHRLVFLNMHVAEGRAAHLKDIRVTKLPNEPILALADKRGALRISPGPKGFEEIAIDVRQLDVLPDRGAFAIKVTFDDGPGIDTFVLANKLVASAQPELTSPRKGQVFNDSRPEIAWRPYRSPELAPWEVRTLSLGISHGPTNAYAWSLYKWEPGELERVRVGDPGTPSATLEPDAYWLDLLYSEERTFGGIRISRGAETGTPFSVVR